MAREMVINAAVPDYVRAAIIDSGRLWGYFQETAELARSRGNVYLGQVASVRPALDACFIEYGAARQGLLPAAEIVPAALEHAGMKKSGRAILKNLKVGTRLLVQVAKEPLGNKGARLTTDISLAGRHLVLMPWSNTRGVSRKIKDESARQTARQMLQQLDAPAQMGIIIRTVAAGQTKQVLARDLGYLQRLWKKLLQQGKQMRSPGLLHAEADLLIRTLRDYYDHDIEKVWLDDDKALDRARAFFKLFAPRQVKRLQLFERPVPIFAHFGLEQQLESIQQRRVTLPSGGSLVIDATEALVAIDVNSGSMSGQPDIETTALKTNLEAAEEIARQLRLRNLGGIIVVDFIDMSKGTHRREVEKKLRRSLAGDKARHRVGPINAFGLCTLTRQRLDQQAVLVGFQACPTCGGSGQIRAVDALAGQVYVQLGAAARTGRASRLLLQAGCSLANALQNRFRSHLAQLEQQLAVHIEIESVPALGPTEFSLSEQADSAAVVEDNGAGASACPSTSGGGEPAPPAKKKRKRRRRRKKPNHAATEPSPHGGDGGQ